MTELKSFGSYFHLPTKTVFDLGKCENCGGEIQEPNAITVTNLDFVDKSGLTEYKHFELPPQIWWDDDIGPVCEVCGSC